MLGLSCRGRTTALQGCSTSGSGLIMLTAEPLINTTSNNFMHHLFPVKSWCSCCCCCCCAQLAKEKHGSNIPSHLCKHRTVKHSQTTATQPCCDSSAASRSQTSQLQLVLHKHTVQRGTTAQNTSSAHDLLPPPLRHCPDQAAVARLCNHVTLRLRFLSPEPMQLRKMVPLCWSVRMLN